MVDNLKTTRDALRKLAGVMKSTSCTLTKRVKKSRISSHWGKDRPTGQLFDTLEHMGDVREGFILSQRTSAFASLTELRDLVHHILTDWGWLEDLDLTLGACDEIESLGQQLVAYNHAIVALGMLPHLPADAVTFPQPQPSYRDVSVPALPSELLARIEEIEHMLYQLELKPITSLEYGPFRRTYAFFEASNWLIESHLAPLLNN